jgi:N6-L-threonylcarbamoyladenine synthase
MNILAIETSCDETACAIVRDGRFVLSNVIASQAEMHAETGGVVPEVAAREHILKILPVIEEALKKAKKDWDDIDAIAVTKGPGLISSLIIGTETASVISHIKDKPLIPVHHVIGHIYANFLSGKDDDAEVAEPEFPLLVLTVSGGHNELILIKDHNDMTILGETRDDAAGEAFDKVARILDLGYPGGPVIAKAAEKGNPEAFKLPRSFLESGSLDFSFSGLKTAVIAEVKEYLKKQGVDISVGNIQTLASKLPQKFKNDLAASFQEAVVDVLSEKLLQALITYREDGVAIKEIHLAGGVSANTRLREVIAEKIVNIADKISGPVKFHYPKDLSYCTDNAAMIGAAAYYLYEAAPKSFKKAQNLTPTTSFDLF